MSVDESRRLGRQCVDRHARTIRNLSNAAKATNLALRGGAAVAWQPCRQGAWVQLQEHAEVGSAILSSLQASRFFDSPEMRRDLIADRDSFYSGFVECLMRKHGCKARRALFKKMASCEIEQVDSMITLRPTHHR